MEYRRLGKAGTKLPEIGLGGWLTFGNALAAEHAKAVIATAFDLGINFFDTADAYAEGECERAWGVLLKNYRRSEYMLATKVFFPTGAGPSDRLKKVAEPVIPKNSISAGRQRSWTATPVVEAKPVKKEPKPKVKDDPQLVAAARELKDRWLEQINSGRYLLMANGKYEVSRLVGEHARIEPIKPARQLAA